MDPASCQTAHCAQEKAEADLSYALQHCHRKAVGNRRRILKYLVRACLLSVRDSSCARKRHTTHPWQPMEWQ